MPQLGNHFSLFTLPLDDVLRSLPGQGQACEDSQTKYYVFHFSSS